MHEEMQEYRIILTWEAIYDVTDIADYIEEEFGQQHADRFQSDLKEQMQNYNGRNKRDSYSPSAAP